MKSQTNGGNYYGNGYQDMNRYLEDNGFPVVYSDMPQYSSNMPVTNTNNAGDNVNTGNPYMNADAYPACSENNVNYQYSSNSAYYGPVALPAGKVPHIPTPKEIIFCRRMCTISLILYVLGHLAFIFQSIIFPFFIEESGYFFNYLPLGLVFELLFCIPAIVLMIIARAKYHKNVFAKVLMWVYVGLAIAESIGFFVAAIFSAFHMVCDAFMSCPG